MLLPSALECGESEEAHAEAEKCQRRTGSTVDENAGQVFRKVGLRVAANMGGLERTGADGVTAHFRQEEERARASEKERPSMCCLEFRFWIVEVADERE